MVAASRAPLGDGAVGAVGAWPAGAVTGIADVRTTGDWVETAPNGILGTGTLGAAGIGTPLTARTSGTSASTVALIAGVSVASDWTVAVTVLIARNGVEVGASEAGEGEVDASSIDMVVGTTVEISVAIGAGAMGVTGEVTGLAPAGMTGRGRVHASVLGAEAAANCVAGIAS